MLWKDGQPTYFTEEVGTEVTGLYVKEGKYIIEGNMTAISSPASGRKRACKSSPKEWPCVRGRASP